MQRDDPRYDAMMSTLRQEGYAWYWGAKWALIILFWVLWVFCFGILLVGFPLLAIALLAVPIDCWTRTRQSNLCSFRELREMSKAQRRRLQWATLPRHFRMPLNLTPGQVREVKRAKREAFEAWQETQHR